MKLLCMIVLGGALAGGSVADDAAATPEKPRTFRRFFGWGRLTNEAAARAAMEIGVTDATVDYRSTNQIAQAHRFGIRAYGVFSPSGPDLQVMAPWEQALQDKLTGAEIPIPRNASPEAKAALEKKRMAIRAQAGTRYGGEPDSPRDVLMQRLPCLSAASTREKSKAALARLCETNGLDGIAFDYIGYSNYKGCYCSNCLALYRGYLAENGLPDEEKSRNTFYLRQLVDFYNAMTDYVKGLRPDYTVAAHLYPVFLPEPLYGNRLKLDLCGQTAAWYFPWPADKIRAYSTRIVAEQDRYFPGVRGVPFMGYYRNSRFPDFPLKSPERVELELNAILDGGADCLMVCSTDDIAADPAVSAVFKKHTSPAGAKGGP